MEFIAKNVVMAKSKAQCIVLSVFADDKQLNHVTEFDKLNHGLISQLIQSGDANCELGKTTLLFPAASSLNQNVLLVGCGKLGQFNRDKAKKVTQSVITQLRDRKIETILWDILTIDEAISSDLAKDIPQIVNDALYQFDQFKSEKSAPVLLSKVTLLCTDSKLIKGLQSNLQQGQIIADAIKSAKKLADMPPNVCNAHYLAQQAIQLAKDHPSVTVSHLDEKALAKLKMNAYLAVGQGSQNESVMTIMEYHGAKDKNAKPYVLVGKGLTFDSGGISIKPAAGMDEMKYDMCGAATVYGVMQAVAQLALPINVVGVMAGCENMPGHNAYRPGDILTTMSGKTVEVLNTDAEGRLVLCDTLTYVERYHPEIVIDIATLTGACIIALGHHYTGVMGNNDDLVSDLVSASKRAGDKAWPLPIDDDFKQQVKSTCADIVNAAGRDGGTITAACFLSHFTEKYKWAHLDIAGTAWKSGANKGATGRPVAMLIHYLLDQKHG